MKRLASLALSLALCAAPAAGVAGCAAQANTQLASVGYVLPSSAKTFAGREARDADELEGYLDDAEQLARQRGDAAKAEEAQASQDRADAFVEANGLYRDGKYAEAQAAYDNILKIAPLHLGANVNLTLALLQQGEDDAALRQALACVSLFPDDAGTWINLQAAGVACGFSVADVFQESWRRFGTGANNRAQLLEKAGLTDVAEFNRIWDAIEVDLREAADKGADAGEGQAIGERCSAALAAHKAYWTLQDGLDKLADKREADRDVVYLQAYLDAVGVQLGMIVDRRFVTPAPTLPFVVADDAFCRIEVTGIEAGGKQLTLKLSVNDKTHSGLQLVARDEWSAANVALKAEGFASVAAGKSEQVELVLEAQGTSSVPDKVTELAGDLAICQSHVAGSTASGAPAPVFELARYPVAYRAS